MTKIDYLYQFKLYNRFMDHPLLKSIKTVFWPDLFFIYENYEWDEFVKCSRLFGLITIIDNLVDGLYPEFEKNIHKDVIDELQLKPNNIFDFIYGKYLNDRVFKQYSSDRVTGRVKTLRKIAVPDYIFHMISQCSDSTIYIKLTQFLDNLSKHNSYSDKSGEHVLSDK